jgi:XrtJ-associated TM-motif-TM protein
MKKIFLFVLICAAMFATPSVLYAQGGGCVNSPENPTAILAIVGSAGGFFVFARARFRARRKL